MTRSGRRRVGSAIVLATAVWLAALTGEPPTPAAAVRPAAAAPLASPTTLPGGVVGVGPSWDLAGKNAADTHYSATDHSIGPGLVGKLNPRWVFTTANDVSATPTVDGGLVYVPDWSGNLWAISAVTGRAVWHDTIADDTGVAGDGSRVSPAYWKGELVIGDGATPVSVTGGAWIVAVNAATGARLWRTEVDFDPAAIITGSPLMVGGVVYVGISSKAESTPRTPTFRGSVVALDAVTGRRLWQTRTVPTGYTGGAVWGSTPAFDAATGLVYVGVGNNYSVPPGVCDAPGQIGCAPPAAGDHFDSVLGLDARTGAVVWSRSTRSADTWTFVKRFGPDYDFGSGPNLFTTTIAGHPTTLVGIGQKSGIYWVLDPADGRVVWMTATGPASALGGILWGTATDGSRIYVANGNGNHARVTLRSATGVTSVTTGGYWSALDAATGQILWQTADPQPAYLDISMLSGADGVIYAGSTAPSGDNMYALDAATGRILWRFASGGSVIGGAAVVGGSVYWGSGYHTAGLGLGYPGANDQLYAFSVPTVPARP